MPSGTYALEAAIESQAREAAQPAPQQHRQVRGGGGVGQHRVVVAAAAEALDRAEAVPAERRALRERGCRAALTTVSGAPEGV